jgi:hypothetical protein
MRKATYRASYAAEALLWVALLLSFAALLPRELGYPETTKVSDLLRNFQDLFVVV